MVEIMIIYTISGVVVAGYAWYKWFRGCRREINEPDGFSYVRLMHGWSEKATGGKQDETLQATKASVEKAVQEDSRPST